MGLLDRFKKPKSEAPQEEHAPQPSAVEVHRPSWAAKTWQPGDAVADTGGAPNTALPNNLPPPTTQWTLKNPSQHHQVAELPLATVFEKMCADKLELTPAVGEPMEHLHKPVIPVYFPPDFEFKR